MKCMNVLILVLAWVYFPLIKFYSFKVKSSVSTCDLLLWWPLLSWNLALEEKGLSNCWRNGLVKSISWGSSITLGCTGKVKGTCCDPTLVYLLFLGTHESCARGVNGLAPETRFCGVLLSLKTGFLSVKEGKP